MDDDNRRGKIAKIITRVHCFRYTNRGSARVRNTFFSSDDFLDAKLGEIRFIMALLNGGWGRFPSHLHHREYVTRLLLENQKRNLKNVYCWRARQKATTRFAITFSFAVPTVIAIGYTENLISKTITVRLSIRI